MERSEPTLVPEWLRSTGSVTGGGNSGHHFAASSMHSDDHSLGHPTRNRSSRSIIDRDTPRSAFLDRTSSSNSRRSSTSNGSTKHPYSSFTRSHRDKNRDKDKERSAIGDLWDNDLSDPLGNILISRGEKDTLRRSRSMVSGKQSEVLTRKALNLKNGSSNNHNRGNDMPSGGSIVSGIQKAAFEKDFPSLRTDEKQEEPDIGRILSPILSTAVQSLPIGSSGLIGGEGWTSALAEVPKIIGSNSTGTSSIQQSAFATQSPGASSALAGLNMAETLSQAPSRARTTPQLPDKTQRLEELALRQCRQLIPMTPSMPKALVLNSSDKSKPKSAARTNDTNVAAKSAQQQTHSSQLATQSLRGEHVKSDAPKTSAGGKFLVLKPVWENGVSSTAKDVSSPTSNNVSKEANSQLAVAPSSPSAPVKSPKLSSVERKAATSIATLEKKPTLSQAQSRSDFFNLMRKKTSKNASFNLTDSGTSALSPTVEKSGEVAKEVNVPVSPCATENGSKVTSNGDTHDDVQTISDVGEKNLCLNGSTYPSEEEVRFLRSLGWEENAGEDEITEEEINAFFQECMKKKPSLKVCRGIQPKLAMLTESHASGSSRGSTELNSHKSESEA
ncbi:uncharacterized protein LOC132274574 [Cornus florida]|uniref:uncharacterized protein LOC132274574 n=1 Tax=Cornus florida TaxID=4283 RepID=UPI00289BA311|nr:uncharacterized protein LOC132274574 [Cornus florida]